MQGTVGWPLGSTTVPLEGSDHDFKVRLDSVVVFFLQLGSAAECARGNGQRFVFSQDCAQSLTVYLSVPSFLSFPSIKGAHESAHHLCAAQQWD